MPINNRISAQDAGSARQRPDVSLKPLRVTSGRQVSLKPDRAISRVSQSALATAVNQTIADVKRKYAAINGDYSTLESGQALGAYVRIDETERMIRPKFNEISASAARGESPHVNIWGAMRDHSKIPKHTKGLVIIQFEGVLSNPNNLRVNVSYFDAISKKIGGHPIFVLPNPKVDKETIFMFHEGRLAEFKGDYR